MKNQGNIDAISVKQSKKEMKKVSRHQFCRRFRADKYLHLMVLPAVIYFIIFCYVPMYGVIIAFKDFSYVKGILGSPWAANHGMEYFISFFNSMYFPRLLKNTLLLSFEYLLFSFPIPIVFALLLNEVTHTKFKKIVQTLSYFPYFVSIVVTVGIMTLLLNPTTGIVNKLIVANGGEAISFMNTSSWFRPLYIISGIWQNFGWSAIIYIAALSGVNSELYEAAAIDGAGYFKRAIYISIPCIAPTIIILFIMACGGLMSVATDKILLMYTPGIYDVADVFDTYVYRRSILGGEFSFGTAVGLFSNIVNFILLFSVNKISKKMSEVSLW